MSTPDPQEISKLPSPKDKDGAFTTELRPVHSNSSVVDAGAGEVKMERQFGALASLGLAFSLLNSWTAMSASLSLILPSGGAVSMMWGLIVSALGTLAMALSLAELCHVFCTSGGQIDWTYILAPKKIRVGLTFLEGWLAVSGWVCLVATASSLGATFIIQLIALWNTEYVSAPWHTFIVYIAFTVYAGGINAFGVRILPMFDTVALVWSLAGLVIVVVVILATARGEFQSASFVWTNWTNNTGWPDGLAFILGLLQSTFGLAGFDAASHMIDELPRPNIDAPRAMVGAVVMGSLTSYVFLMVLLFVLSDFDAVLTSSAGPLIEVYYQATSSRAGATGLVMFNLIAMLFASQCVMTGGTRMVHAFARDRGFGPLSAALARVHPTLKSPVWSVAFTSGWVAVFACIFLGSSSALSAILSSSIALLQASYIIPIALICWRGEAAFDLAPHGQRTLSLGKFRRPVNMFALCFACLTTVTFCFPPAADPTGSSMNYVAVVVGIVLLLAGGTWLVDGRNFSGPADIDARLAAAALETDKEV